MFKILRKSAQTGLVTIGYPEMPAAAPEHVRGAPRFDFIAWRDARPAAEACPTAAILIHESNGTRQVVVDYGKCIYSGECAQADPDAIEMTHERELAVTDRRDLVVTAEYAVNHEGIQYELTKFCMARGWPGGCATKSAGSWDARSRSAKWTRVPVMDARSKLRL
jgi:formate hydrogenlyase subunit 6/NADH:ubiquinone oxidoreductase subunit I